MQKYVCSTLFTLGVTAVSFPAWSSGGHYPVDDTELAEPGALQIETWYTRVDGSAWEFAFLPAITLQNMPLELTAGYARVKDDGERFHRFEPSAKWQFNGVDAGQLGAALSLTAGHEDGRFTDWLLNLPLSYQFMQAPVTLLANAGWLRERDEGWNDRLFIGGGFEWEAAPRATVIGQIYREGSDVKPEAQLGLRFGGGGALEHIDLALGRVLGDDKDWFFTFGLTLEL